METVPLLTPTTPSTTLVEDFPALVDPSAEIDFDDELHAGAEAKLSIAEKLTTKVASLYRDAHRTIFPNSIYKRRLYCDEP